MLLCCLQSASKRLGVSLGALSSGRVGIAGMAGINMGKALTVAIRLEKYFNFETLLLLLYNVPLILGAIDITMNFIMISLSISSNRKE